jgi:hypothetical protein
MVGVSEIVGVKLMVAVKEIVGVGEGVDPDLALVVAREQDLVEILRRGIRYSDGRLVRASKISPHRSSGARHGRGAGFRRRRRTIPRR